MKYNDIYNLMKLWGERFVHCDDEQAHLDVEYARTELVDTFSAIMNIAEQELYDND